MPVFDNIASCSEIPDAIGWSSVMQWTGSTVVECKTSVADFYADKAKYFQWRHKQHGWRYRGRFKDGEAQLYEKVFLPRMGNYRYFMCEAGLIEESLVLSQAPDHGLLWCKGRTVRVIVPAPLRLQDITDFESEIRYLRFAIINQKKPYQPGKGRQEVLAL